MKIEYKVPIKGNEMVEFILTHIGEDFLSKKGFINGLSIEDRDHLSGGHKEKSYVHSCTAREFYQMFNEVVENDQLKIYIKDAYLVRE